MPVFGNSFYSLFIALSMLGCDSNSPAGLDEPGAVDAPFVGSWTVATNEVDLSSGPVRVVLGGAATQSWVQSNLGANIWGTKLSYTFNTDRTYTATYKARVVSGVFVSETETEEIGRFEFAGTRLTLRPDRQDGWIYVGHPSNRQDIDEGELDARSYEVGLLEDDQGAPYLFLLGACGTFQIEPWCERNDVAQDIGVLFEQSSV